MERTTPVEWQGRTVDAADPAPIAHAAVDLTPATIRATERAAATMQATEDRTGPAVEVTGRLLLRAEGLSSSAIEGLRASADAVMLAQAGSEADPTASWVADNLAVVTDALQTASPLHTKTLLAWHRRLMRHAIGFDPDHIGTWRPVLGWIGGPNPLVAAHVAAPPALIEPAMKDLIVFLQRDDVDPVTMAAIAHAQFETIHPFADGNGRIGRVLIGWVLATGLDLAVPPPVSTAFARDIGGYLSGLTLYRQGHVDHWVRWFASAVLGAAERTNQVLTAVEQVQAHWLELISPLRADAAARKLVDLLAIHPIVNTAIVAQALDVSTTTARTALIHLADLGILAEVATTPMGTGRPTIWWSSPDLVELLGI